MLCPVASLPCTLIFLYRKEYTEVRTLSWTAWSELSSYRKKAPDRVHTMSCTFLPMFALALGLAFAQNGLTLTVSRTMTTLQVFDFGGGASGIEATSVAVPLLVSIVSANPCQTTVAIGYGANSTAVTYHADQIINATKVVNSSRHDFIMASRQLLSSSVTR